MVRNIAIASLMDRQPGPVSDILHATETFVKQYMQQYDSSHDWSHIQRVSRLAGDIADTESSLNGAQYDGNIIKLAALLHDIGDAKYAQPGDPIDPVRQFLKAQGAPDEMAATVQDIVDRVSYSKEVKNTSGVQRLLAKHPELAVVQDADRLDALGAVGIGRCFTYGASSAERQRTEQRLSKDIVDDASIRTTNTMHNAIAHFEDKLQHLEGMMKTETGKRIARKRTERLTIFHAWWDEEQYGAL